jgi:hypothetical protein
MPPKPATRSQPSGRAASRQSQNPVDSQANANADGIREDEVSQTGNHNGEDELRPPLAIDLAQVMATQTCLLETLAQGMNRPRNNHGAGVQDKMTEFMRLKPPTFAGSDNPMKVDDWLKVIERKLDTIHYDGRDRVMLATHQLTGIALSWWEAYSGVVDNANTITWQEFVEEFCRYHIPDRIMKLKDDEFRNLKQGNKTLSEYISSSLSYLAMVQN